VESLAVVLSPARKKAGGLPVARLGRDAAEEATARVESKVNLIMALELGFESAC
jgi:hypothetical protein